MSWLRPEDKLAALAEEIGGLAIRCDVTEWDDMRRLADEAGATGVVFADAGFGDLGGFMEGDVEDWKAIVLTNV